MNFLKIVKSTVIVGSILVLAACNKKPAVNGADMSDQTGGVSAQTYAQAMQGGFQVDQHGRRINPLTAPANQTYYFDYDSNVLHASDYQAMNIQASYLVSHPSAKIRLEGNTDERGSREYNIALGWRRAEAVANYFKMRGVSASQITMVSYGKERPIAFGANAKAYGLNRRDDLIYTQK